MCRVYRLGTCTCNNLFVRSKLATGAQVDGVGEVDHVGDLDQHVYTVAPAAVVLLYSYNQSRKKNRLHDPVLVELMNTTRTTKNIVYRTNAENKLMYVSWKSKSCVFFLVSKILSEIFFKIKLHDCYIVSGILIFYLINVTVVSGT